MEIKCKTYPINSSNYQRPHQQEFTSRRERIKVQSASVGTTTDIFVTRPNAEKSAFGLSSSKGLLARCKDAVIQYCKNYKKNIQHTYDNKIVFALIEKELYGKNSIDSITHDADKMIMYLLGFPKSVVSKVHRSISVHHPESGKQLNLRSMLCDNIASSPQFKPEKKYSLREYYNLSKELQEIPGFGELVKKYNFGDNIDFSKIKALKQYKYDGFVGLWSVAYKSLLLAFIH